MASIFTKLFENEQKWLKNVFYWFLIDFKQNPYLNIKLQRLNKSIKLLFEAISIKMLFTNWSKKFLENLKTILVIFIIFLTCHNIH